MLAFMVRLALFIALSIMGAGPTDAIVVSISGAIAGISLRRLHNRRNVIICYFIVAFRQG